MYATLYAKILHQESVQKSKTVSEISYLLARNFKINSRITSSQMIGKKNDSQMISAQKLKVPRK